MGTLQMSEKERRRLSVMNRVKDGLIKLKAASQMLRLSYRHTKRVWRRFKAQGDAGLIHRRRGCRSNRRLPEATKERALELCRTRYAGFGPTLAAEHLHQNDKLLVDHETLRRWMLADGSWEKRKSRARHRKWRERKANMGEMIQMDGSNHDWFEGRGERAVLMVMIDDATNYTYARFYEAESTASAFDVFGRYARREGLPGNLYVDRDSIYKTERQARIDEELRDEPALTQFRRAMKRLGVELLLANSPQAKGRVERRHAVFQDRLVKEMRLRGIDSIEEANAYLEQEFLKDLNRRFTVPAREGQNVHRPIPAGIRLDEVLCWEDDRVVQNDWTVRWRNRWFQIEARHAGLSLSGKKITMRQLMDGQLQILWQKNRLRYRELPQRPQRCRSAIAWRKRTTWRPPEEHPWKQTIREAVRKRDSRKPATALRASAGFLEKGTFLSSPTRGHF